MQLDEASWHDLDVALLLANGPEPFKRGLLELSERWVAEDAAASDFRNRGHFYMAADEPELALADFTKAMEMEPSDPHHWDGRAPCRADAYASLGRWEEALADYVKGAELFPDFSVAHYFAANACCQLERWGEASEYFCRAIEIEPEAAVLHYWDGLACLGAGDQESYRRRCAEILEHFAGAEDPETARWVAWTCALAPDALEDLAPVLALAELAVSADPQSQPYAGALGGVLYRCGRYEEAIEAFTTAGRLAGDEQGAAKQSPAYGWYFTAMAHHRLGHPEEAAEWLKKARTLAASETDDPEHPPLEPPPDAQAAGRGGEGADHQATPLIERLRPRDNCGRDHRYVDASFSRACY